VHARDDRLGEPLTGHRERVELPVAVDQLATTPQTDPGKTPSATPSTSMTPCSVAYAVIDRRAGVNAV
jgi:hypothetical protein